MRIPNAPGRVTRIPVWLMSCLTVLLIAGCQLLPMQTMQSANYSERVKFLILHYTAINYERSVRALVDEGGLSSHYLVPESDDPTYPHDELQVLQLVDEHQRAWHAGRSYWQGRENLNDQSIGIEIVNVPTCQRLRTDVEGSQSALQGQREFCFYPDYDPKQVDLLVTLIKGILERNPDIGPTQIIGHSDIAPGRKPDPGPRFPWYQLYKKGIGAWYEEQTVGKYWQDFAQRLPDTEVFQAALTAYGYKVAETGLMDADTLNALSAFQMHFLPWRSESDYDARVAAVLFALLDRYFPKKAAALMERYHSSTLTKPKLVSIQHGQVDQWFPETEEQRSSREWVNDKLPFKAYQGKGTLIIDNETATSADIYVNGEKLNITQPFDAYQQYRYSLSRRTRDGVNTLEVKNVLPEGSRIKVRIPYPELVYESDNQARFSRVDALIEQEIEQGFPGAVLLVLKDGKIIKNTAYGARRLYADGGELLTKPIPMLASTPFDLASNTKMFATNLALMKLVSQGKLDVNAPVSQYLKEYRHGGREIRTVKDLLTHTAGYGPQVRFHTPQNSYGEMFFSHDQATTKQLISQRVPFKHARGKRHVYSDTDYMLLGMLVERITGMPLDTYVETQIYHRLGLKETLFNPLLKGRMASRYAATEIHGTTRDGRVEHDNIREYVLQGEVHDEKAFYSLQGVAGHAGLFSTSEELAVLAQLLLNRGGYGEIQLFDAAVLDAFTKPEETDATYGLGWRRASEGQRRWHFGAWASPQAYGHTGWTGTVTVIDPEHDMAVILLTNARHTPIVEDEDGRLEFAGKQFETGKYGSIITLVYEAILNEK